MEKQRWRVIILAFSLLLVVQLLVRVILVQGASPYIIHRDEPFVSGPAMNMLKTGDLNPHFFKYPSLPAYLTAAGLTVGYLHACSMLKLKTTNQIRKVEYPYYDPPEVVFPARLLFLILSVATLALSGLISLKLSNNHYLFILSPLILSISSQFLRLSWSYLNVDIIGTFFVALAIYILFRHHDKDDFFHRVAAPGLVCGMAVASKYNLFLIIVPFMLFNLFYGLRRFIPRTLGLMLFVFIGFVAVVPFSILDFNKFINDVGNEVFHYSYGHLGQKIEPGLPHLLFNLEVLIGLFGWMSPLLILFGAIYIFRLDWKKGAIFFSFPVLYLLYMSSQKTSMMRNLLPVSVFYAIACAFGLLLIVDLASRLIGKIRFFSGDHSRARLAARLSIGVLVIASLPWVEIIRAYDLSPDSRNQAVEWIKASIPRNSKILVATELGINTVSLEKRYQIQVVPFKWLPYREIDKILRKNRKALVLRPHYGEDPRYKYRLHRFTELNSYFRSRVSHKKRFGTKPVLENSTPPASYGDPSFSIVRIRKPKNWKGFGIRERAWSVGP